MSEMIERAARAQCGKIRCLHAQLGIGLCVKEDLTNAPCQATRDQLILSGRWDAARAAIEALREPTEAMWKAGDREVEYDHERNLRLAWDAMLTEALK